MQLVKYVIEDPRKTEVTGSIIEGISFYRCVCTTTAKFIIGFKQLYLNAVPGQQPTGR
jgi:hypothetical protein